MEPSLNPILYKISDYIYALSSFVIPAAMIELKTS